MATVTLPDKLITDVQNIVTQGKEFSDVSAYITYIMEQVVAKKQQATLPANQTQPSYSKADEDKIRERLKNLGYLD